MFDQRRVSDRLGTLLIRLMWFSVNEKSILPADASNSEYKLENPRYFLRQRFFVYQNARKRVFWLRIEQLVITRNKNKKLVPGNAVKNRKIKRIPSH